MHSLSITSPEVQSAVAAASCSVASEEQLGEVALATAVEYGVLRDVQTFVENNIADPAQQPDLLFVACEHGHVDVVNYLIQRCGLSASHALNDGTMPLHVASRFNRRNCVRALLEAGCHVDGAAGPSGVSPLMEACEHGAEQTASELLRARADVCKARSNGATPLHEAASRGRTKLSRALLAAGAPVDAQLRVHPNLGPHGCTTALWISCAHGHTQVARLLLDARADASLPLLRLQTPYQAAMRNRHSATALMLARVGCAYYGNPDGTSCLMGPASSMGGGSAGGGSAGGGSMGAGLSRVQAGGAVVECSSSRGDVALAQGAAALSGESSASASSSSQAAFPFTSDLLASLPSVSPSVAPPPLVAAPAPAVDPTEASDRLLEAENQLRRAIATASLGALDDLSAAIESVGGRAPAQTLAEARRMRDALKARARKVARKQRLKAEAVARAEEEAGTLAQSRGRRRRWRMGQMRRPQAGRLRRLAPMEPRAAAPPPPHRLDSPAAQKGPLQVSLLQQQATRRPEWWRRSSASCSASCAWTCRALTSSCRVGTGAYVRPAHKWCSRELASARCAGRKPRRPSRSSCSASSRGIATRWSVLHCDGTEPSHRQSQCGVPVVSTA